MVIVVNTRLLIPGRLDGIGRFSYETLQRMTTQHPDDQFVFLFDRAISEEFIFSPNITPVKLLPPARRAFLFKIWFNWSVASVLRDLQPDLFLSPDGIIPLRTKTPCLPVIHDLNFEHYPEDIHPRYINYYRKYYPQFAHKATRVATVSEYSKSDLVKTYGLAPEKIDVVYNGASHGFRQLDEETATAVRAKYSDGAPYFLFVGSLHPRKNIVRLVQAFGQFRSKHDLPHKLLIVGERFWGNEALNKVLQDFPYNDDVVFTGRISPAALHSVMGAAFALTYVPYFEGFGIPIVEAMQCGVPVITANVTSMPEVAGDAALLVDPFSVDSIAAALETMALDAAKRDELIAKAIARHNVFNWDRTTELLWDSMMKTIEQART